MIVAFAFAILSSPALAHEPSPMNQWLKLECKGGSGTLQVLYDPNGKQTRFQFTDGASKSPFLKGDFDTGTLERRLHVRSNNPIPDGRYDLKILFNENPMTATLEIDGNHVKKWHLEKKSDERTRFEWSECTRVTEFSEKIIEGFNLESISKSRGTVSLRKVGAGTGTEYDVMILETSSSSAKEKIFIQLNATSFEVIKATRAFSGREVEVTGERKEDRIVVMRTSDISIVLSQTQDGQTVETLNGEVSKERVAKGTKSEHDAWVLKQADGSLLQLLVVGGNPFEAGSDSPFAAFNQLKVEVTGVRVGGSFKAHRIRFQPDCDRNIDQKK